MDYETIKDSTLVLHYRDKLRLAQLLIQLARKEEEEQYVVKFDEPNECIDFNYVKERLLKSKPSKLKSLENFIEAMFQFKGSISADDKQKLLMELQKKKVLVIENNNVTYI